MAMLMDRLTLEAALVGYQRKLEEIESKMSDIRRRLGGSRPAAATAIAAAAPRTRKHRMSAAGRERIAAAQRARWAKFKKAKKSE